MTTTETPAPTSTRPESGRTTGSTDQPTTDQANKAFSTSILISAVRCTLAYVVFPWVLPAVGVAGGVGPGIGLGVGVIAIGFNVASIRRFHASDHRWKWQITVLNCCVIAMLSVLAVMDLSDLVG